MASSSPNELLLSVVNHVALPPQVPAAEDHEPPVNQELLRRLVRAAQFIRDHTNSDALLEWEQLLSGLKASQRLNFEGQLDKATVVDRLRELSPGVPFILHVPSQNSGILVYRGSGDESSSEVFLEVFETSASSAAVLASENALRWEFPGSTIAIPYQKFMETSFLNHMSTFLQDASSEYISNFAPTITKAGARTAESRDTVNPALVSQFLVTVLEAIGRRSPSASFGKRIRDEVSWADGSELPWRRSPLWLAMRAGVQSHLQGAHGLDLGRFRYKILITIVVAQLLRDSTQGLEPGMIALLKAKLGRRLAKLELFQSCVLNKSSKWDREIGTFKSLHSFFEGTMLQATAHIDSMWTNFKQRTKRLIPRLPSQAQGSDMVLALPNSGKYLDDILRWNAQMYAMAGRPQSVGIPSGYDRYGTESTKMGKFTNLHFNLALLEATMSKQYEVCPNPADLQQIANDINCYMGRVGTAYDADAEQKSIVILHLLRMWSYLDQITGRQHPLILEYHPGFPPEILNHLHLTEPVAMEKLREIQDYLQMRHDGCSPKKLTFFEDPSPACFAVRYFDSCATSSPFHTRLSDLESAALAKKTDKEREWERRISEAKEFDAQIAAATCIRTQVSDEDIHFRRCRRCFLRRKRRRMRIEIFEDPLPSNVSQKKALVFELDPPPAFKLYRNATWAVLQFLESHGQRKRSEGPPTLANTPFFQSYFQSYLKSSNSVSLASTTKPFEKTHYRQLKLPVALSEVLHPCGLTFKYFDTQKGVWAAPQSYPLTITHHLRIPDPLRKFLFPPPSTSLEERLGSHQISSYDVMANQSNCATELNVHEFNAINQAVAISDELRWMNLLIELGSSNLNFSSETTRNMVDTICSRSGLPGDTDSLRMAYQVFRDTNFCNRLSQIIQQKLDSISSNWREANCMDSLITLILHLCAWVSTTDDRYEAYRLLQVSRDKAYHWVKTLRAEIHASSDPEAARTFATYIVNASLLYRKTFSVLSWGSDGSGCPSVMEEQEFSRWIEVSIIFRDSMPSDPSALPTIQQNAIIRDSKLVIRLLKKLEESILTNPGSFATAVNRIMSVDENEPISEVALFPGSWWIQATAHATESMGLQVYSYNLAEGYFLVDGQPMGQLPAEHRESAVLHELFGKQNFSTLPSRQRGMTHMIAHRHYGHQVHIGFRDGTVFVRAFCHGSLLEYVPKHIFVSNSQDYDLPAHLVDNCVHWLNLNTGEVEVRVQSDMWRSKRTSWKISVRSRTASRTYPNVITLIDHSSRLFRQIASTFAHFEEPKYLVVSESQKERQPPLIRVELRRLELTFTVNKYGLLYSQQLLSEIDPNQDAGTWYGLRSLLVLRNAVDPLHRVAIVPIGPLVYSRNDFHVDVCVENSGAYGRFTINKTLGRIECPPEPVLVYSKAMFHAYTSFVAPDPLTGRTGTEEAFHCLTSGSSSPWTPLNQGPINVLSMIAKLIPVRTYYPTDKKVLERVKWDTSLPFTVQHDGYLQILQAIMEKSRVLGLFSSSIDIPMLIPTELHLSRRSLYRRSLSEPPWESVKPAPPADSRYQSRHFYHPAQSIRNVFETTQLLVQQPSKIKVAGKLSSLMAAWNDVGGFAQPFGSPFLSDILNASLEREWGSFIQLCHQADAVRDPFGLVFTLALLAYHEDTPMDLVRILVAFAMYPEFKSLELPPAPQFVQFRYYRSPSVNSLTPFIMPHAVSLPDSRFRRLHPGISKTNMLEHERAVKAECEAIAKSLVENWPCEDLPDIECSTGLVLVSQALESIRPEWNRIYQNWQLSALIDSIQSLLQLRRSSAVIPTPAACEYPSQPGTLRVPVSWQPCLSELLLCSSKSFQKFSLHCDFSGDPKDYQRNTQFKSAALSAGASPDKRPSMIPEGLEELRYIVGDLGSSASAVKTNYAAALASSIEAFQSRVMEINPYPDSIQREFNTQRLKTSPEQLQDFFDRIMQSLEQEDLRSRWLKLAGIWPAATPIALLQELRSISPTVYDKPVKNVLTAYGRSITELQQMFRIQNAILQRDGSRLEQERRNPGHENWNPLKHPDWLLFEIEANVMLRAKQTEVAAATIWPSSGGNSVLQMNMGEGKTSCIMMLCAATLADFDQLARVVVPNALLLQTAQLLHSRLGGLLGRSVTHVPWSRKTATDTDTVNAYRALQLSAKENAGVLISLPEHILSFMLSGQQRLSDGRISEAEHMIRLQDWLQTTCRDVLDECDHTLAVRTQLIYPSGSQTAVDGHPHRWETIEELLKLVESHVWRIRGELPHSIDVVSTGGFTIIHFLRKDAENTLVQRLVDDVLEDRISLLHTLKFGIADRQIIRLYLSEPVVSYETGEEVQRIYSRHPVALQNLHLIRGLLGQGILLLTLKKRWNVQYGLHPDRDPLAVPYHAKGVPSDQAEWGHPDVAIVFTCLAFYYGGLRFHELKQCLEHVAKSDDPPGEYERWHHRSSNLPDSLRDWNSITIGDESQLIGLWKHVRCEAAIIDNFLNLFVFPKHAKQFTTKLQSSGWDLPITSAAAMDSPETCRRSLTTGFSGTNDNRTLLPLTIQQRDLPALAHTNAEVLTYLLQMRNRRAIIATDERGARLPELSLLKRLHHENIRVLIDAGAMILEMDNATVASEWLKVDWKAPAAVYFDEKNKPTVLARSGTRTPLVATPYAENLGEALVYLDQSHTRGTDLSIPRDAIGGLTLGLGQTKDATVQAAMRLRQLATTQSVVFFAPPEVYQSLIDLQQKPAGSSINSHDVIRWLLEQTCIGLEQLQPLYYAQGLDFCRRREAAVELPQLACSPEHRESYLAKLRHDELQTLERMYKPQPRDDSSVNVEQFSLGIRPLVKTLESLRHEFESAGYMGYASALDEVEQEREVAFEVECVQEVQKPVRYQALEFPGLHQELIQFITSGNIVDQSAAYQPVAFTMRITALGQRKKLEERIMTSPLFASNELSRTIKLNNSTPNDNFMRPVNWILYSREKDIAIIVNPEEAEAALPIMRNLQNPPVHLLLYSAPVTRKMMHFNNLTFYSVPAMPANWRAPERLCLELGLFAGRLFFEYVDYEVLARLLGHTADSGSHESHVRPQETFQASGSDMNTGDQLLFFQDWLSIRRKGQDFMHTPMGTLCRGKPLASSHPFFSTLKKREDT